MFLLYWSTLKALPWWERGTRRWKRCWTGWGRTTGWGRPWKRRPRRTRRCLPSAWVASRGGCWWLSPALQTPCLTTLLPSPNRQACPPPPGCRSWRWLCTPGGDLAMVTLRSQRENLTRWCWPESHKKLVHQVWGCQWLLFTPRGHCHLGAHWTGWLTSSLSVSNMFANQVLPCLEESDSSRILNSFLIVLLAVFAARWSSHREEGFLNSRMRIFAQRRHNCYHHQRMSGPNTKTRTTRKQRRSEVNSKINNSNDSP